MKKSLNLGVKIFYLLPSYSFTCIPSFMYTLSFEFLEVKLKEVNPVRRSAIFKWKDPLGALNLVFAPKGILSSF